jgi:signal transduction histidine kinase
VQQERELAILKAIIQTVSSSHNLKDTLEAALEIVLSVVNSSIGWICLLDEEKSCSAFVGYKNMCTAGKVDSAQACLAQCVCGRVRKTGEAVIVRQLAQGCPLCELQGKADQKVVGHISVPLTTSSRIVGQLNVAFSDPEQADQIDVALLRTVSPQLAVAVENARLWEEIQEKERLQKELLKRVVLAQEEERRRISRELHDEMGQELTSLLFRLQVLEKLSESQQCSDIVTGLKKTAANMISSIHDLALELRPTILDDLGLAPALAQYAKICPDHLGITVDFSVIGAEASRLTREVETTLYRVVQESLTNVARHSGAHKASVLLKFNEKNIVAIIEDNGVGFDLKDIKTAQVKLNRLGLYGMEERVSLVGGTLTIESKPGEGTILYVEIPMKNG